MRRTARDVGRNTRRAGQHRTHRPIHCCGGTYGRAQLHRGLNPSPPPSPRARSTISLPHIQKKHPEQAVHDSTGSKLQLQIHTTPHARSDTTHLPEAVVGSVRPEHEEETERPRHDRVRDGGNLKTTTRTPGQNHRKGRLHTSLRSLFAWIVSNDTMVNDSMTCGRKKERAPVQIHASLLVCVLQQLLCKMQYTYARR